MNSNASGSPGAQQMAQEVAEKIVKNLKPAQRAFTVEVGNTIFAVYYSRFPEMPHEAITVVVIPPENRGDPIVVATILEGWLGMQEVRGEIAKARRQLS